MFKTRYRVCPDSLYGGIGSWQVEKRLWLLPFWIEVGNGLMTKQNALAIKTFLEEQDG